jgi:hypothetical protein
MRLQNVSSGDVWNFSTRAQCQNPLIYLYLQWVILNSHVNDLCIYTSIYGNRCTPHNPESLSHRGLQGNFDPCSAWKFSTPCEVIQ